MAYSFKIILRNFIVGRHQLGIHIVYLSGNPADPANKEYRVHYSVMGQGETPLGALVNALIP